MWGAAVVMPAAPCFILVSLKSHKLRLPRHRKTYADGSSPTGSKARFQDHTVGQRGQPSAMRGFGLPCTSLGGESAPKTAKYGIWKGPDLTGPLSSPIGSRSPPIVSRPVIHGTTVISIWRRPVIVPGSIGVIIPRSVIIGRSCGGCSESQSTGCDPKPDSGPPASTPMSFCRD
jgi:hypothetical protein